MEKFLKQLEKTLISKKINEEYRKIILKESGEILYFSAIDFILDFIKDKKDKVEVVEILKTKKIENLEKYINKYNIDLESLFKKKEEEIFSLLLNI